jgi:prophage regulatory protein
MNTHIENSNRLIRLVEVLKIIGLSRSQLYKMQRDGLFPRSIKLSTRAVAWREAEVLNWCFSRSHSVGF